MLNAELVPWEVGERPYVAPGRLAKALGSDHGPVVLSIPLAVAATKRVTCIAYSQAHSCLHEIQSDSPQVRKVSADVLQWSA